MGVAGEVAEVLDLDFLAKVARGRRDPKPGGKGVIVCVEVDVVVVHVHEVVLVWGGGNREGREARAHTPRRELGGSGVVARSRRRAAILV